LTAINTNNYWIVTSNPIPVGQWTHVALVFDSNGARGYVNGALVGSNSSATTYDCSVNNWTIGTFAYDNLTLEPFAGSIDNVRIYRSALTAVDVQRLYGQESLAYTE
jgi:hypothetical protein